MQQPLTLQYLSESSQSHFGHPQHGAAHPVTQGSQHGFAQQGAAGQHAGWQGAGQDIAQGAAHPQPQAAND